MEILFDLSVDDDYAKDYDYYNDDSPEKVATKPHHSKPGIFSSKTDHFTRLIS